MGYTPRKQENQMKTLISFAIALTLLSSGAVGQRYDNDNRPFPQQDQNYNQDRQQDRNYNQDRQYGERRGGSKWRPGEVLPGQLLNRVVGDWEERGLSRPPGGHQWVRVGEQFILVRGRDRMIARVLNFD
jgi:Ni/Co efflux regulator RcnB